MGPPTTGRRPPRPVLRLLRGWKYGSLRLLSSWQQPQLSRLQYRIRQCECAILTFGSASRCEGVEFVIRSGCASRPRKDAAEFLRGEVLQVDSSFLSARDVRHV